MTQESGPGRTPNWPVVNRLTVGGALKAVTANCLVFSLAAYYAYASGTPLYETEPVAFVAAEAVNLGWRGLVNLAVSGGKSRSDGPNYFHFFPFNFVEGFVHGLQRQMNRRSRG